MDFWNTCGSLRTSNTSLVMSVHITALIWFACWSLTILFGVIFPFCCCRTKPVKNTGDQAVLECSLRESCLKGDRGLIRPEAIVIGQIYTCFITKVRGTGSLYRSGSC